MGKDQEKEEVRRNTISKQPIDHGYAWVILIASMICSFHTVGSFKIFGILYAEFIQEYKTTATAASLLQLTQPIVYSLSSLLVSTVGMTMLTCRQGAIIGGILSFLSIGLSAFAGNIYVLIFTYSFLSGIGSSFVFTSSVVIITFYFDKKRGLASGLLTASGSFGGLVMVPLIRVLIDVYMLSGALIVFSGLMCHIIVGAFLFRPTSFYKENERILSQKHDRDDILKDESRILDSTTVQLLSTENGVVKKEFKDFSKSLVISEPFLNNKATEETPDDNFQKLCVRSNSETRHINSRKTKPEVNQHDDDDENGDDGDDHHNHSFSIHTLYLGGGQFHSLHSINICVDSNEKEDYVRYIEESVKGSKTVLLKFFKFYILKNWTFLRFLMAFGLGSVGTISPLFYIPIFAQEQNIDVQRADMLVVAMGASDVIGRVLSGFASDRISMKRQYLIAISFLLNGIYQALVHVHTTYWSLVMFSIITGFLGAAVMAMYPATLLDILGLQTFNSALSLMWLSQGIAFGASSPIVGIIRDMTGSYTVCFYFFGATLVAASFIILVELIPCCKPKS